MKTQNKKQFEPVKLTLSKEVVMVLNNQSNNSFGDDTITVLIPNYPSKRVDQETNCTSIIE